MAANSLPVNSPIAWRGPAHDEEFADGSSPQPRRSPRLVELDKRLLGLAITKETASEPGNDPPNLNHFRKAGSRGPASKPAIWYQRMTGRAWGDDDPERRAERAAAYEKEKMRWRGWVGGNEKRVKQRQSRCMCRSLASPPTRLLHRPPACTSQLPADRGEQRVPAEAPAARGAGGG